LHTVLVDTNAYGTFKRNDPILLKVFRHALHIIVPSIVLGELLAGFLLGSLEHQNRENLARFLDAPRVEVLSATEKTADFYALSFRPEPLGGAPKKRTSNPLERSVDCRRGHGARSFVVDPGFAFQKH
jgi:hypothetical protein